jgi:hypothetical protein
MRRHAPVALAFAALAMASTPAAAQRVTPAPAAGIRCDYAQKIECTSEGCQPSAPGGGFLRLPPLATLIEATARATTAASLPAIQVCDAKSCTPIAVRAVRGGAFVNIAQDGGAHFVKVAATDIPPGIHKGDFVEVAARFLTTATYVGSCPALVR